MSILKYLSFPILYLLAGTLSAQQLNTEALKDCEVDVPVTYRDREAEAAWMKSMEGTDLVVIVTEGDDQTVVPFGELKQTINRGQFKMIGNVGVPIWSFVLDTDDGEVHSLVPSWWSKEVHVYQAACFEGITEPIR